MTEPKKWRDMTPEEKGALLLAHHEGKAIQMHYGTNRWGGSTPDWYDDVAYRVKPPEPRVWWVAVNKRGDGFVGAAFAARDTAEKYYPSNRIVRVVECPDE